MKSFYHEIDFAFQPTTPQHICLIYPTTLLNSHIYFVPGYSFVSMSTHGPRFDPQFAPDAEPSADYFRRILFRYRKIINVLPFFCFALESLVAVACSRVYADSDWMLKMMFAQLLAVNSTLAGMLHFYPPMYKFYTSMIFLPFQDFWLYATGFCFIVGGLMVAFTRTLRLGAWILIAILILVFPGNVACVVSPFPRKIVFGGSVTGALLRLPFQITFILWALWMTSGLPQKPVF